MEKQLSISFYRDELAEVRTKKKEFLDQISRIVPWGTWEAEIEPYVVVTLLFFAPVFYNKTKSMKNSKES